MPALFAPQPPSTPIIDPNAAQQHHAPARANQRSPPPGPIENTENTKSRKTKRASINIATLNMNGYRAAGRTNLEKWSMVNQTLNKHKIAILAIQETHLDPERVDTLHTTFGKKMEIIFSADPNAPRATAGVAFVINKSLITPKKITTRELIPGRALHLKVEWLDNEETSLVNVYVPNERAAHEEFWNEVNTTRQTNHLPAPNFLLGDFNVTEDLIDRMPARLDDVNAIEALRDTRLGWSISDTWRMTYPDNLEYTYRANTANGEIKSRLDRIYVARHLEPMMFDWDIAPSPVPTDHWLVIAKYAPKDSPEIGKGRWTLPLHLASDEEFLNSVIARGMTLQLDLERIQQNPPTRDQNNPQRLWKALKADIQTLAKRAMKEREYKLDSHIKALRKDINELNKNPQASVDNNIRTNERLLERELKYLENKRARNKKDLLSATLAHHGETLGGVWSSLSKEKKPRDYLRRLKIPNSQPPKYERDSRRMADLAKRYHENLQSADLDRQDLDTFEASLNLLLEEIPESQTLANPDESPLNWLAKETHTERALHHTKNGSATGMDGCPYELWKALQRRHNEASKSNKPSFNIIKTLTEVFRDIQTFGVDETTDFALGWMCPIYKKKDPTEICNYRPITLLNSDYKLLTKVLAIQLMSHIESLVHSDQAGFIPRRSILDQIKLAKTIISYAEAAEEDGAIIALDQEKAYDKIRHDYLWKTLEAFNLPQPFIATIRSLYENASTRVAINGMLSKPFKVTRGIRQGDPISCPIFDLAIEPLACMVRNDNAIGGLLIPGLETPIKINLFADDTVIYLSHKDNLTYVQEALQDWCHVSGAKFNLEKTEIIPIGSEEYRRRVVLTRKINPDEIFPIAEGVKIARDGDAVRYLGAWIGNRINDLTPWETILEKIHKSLSLWSKMHPTMKGRTMIIQAVVGGRTQYLTKAQGMPSHIETALTKIIRDFMWEKDSSPRIALEALQRPISEGGLNLLDIKARNEAIDIIWLKEYLRLTPMRPTWAKIADLLIEATAPERINKKARMNVFLQSWEAPIWGGRAARLDESMIRMIKVGKKYNLNLAAIRLSPELCSQLPAWYHLAAEPKAMTGIAPKCLLNRHKITKVADLMKASARLRNQDHAPEHQPNLLCICRDCVNDRINGCQQPYACAQEALQRLNLIIPRLNPLRTNEHGNLSHTRTRKTQNEIARASQGAILFDPSVTDKDDLTECFRIFTDPERISDIPAERLHGRGRALRMPEINVYTDGACMKNGKADARSGSGIWIEPDHAWNKSLRVPGTIQSNQTGEIMAIIAAAATIPPNWPMKILSDSKYAIDGLTTHLKEWEDRGWINIKNAKPFKKAAHLLKRRTAKTTFQWVKGHEGIQGNEESDRLAKEGAEKDAPDQIDMEIPKNFDLQGAKLSAITQAIAYRGIQERKPPYPREIAMTNIQKARDAINDYCGNMETDESLWTGIYNPSINTRIRQFIYKSMHGTQKIGGFWRHIQGYEEREMCQTCQVTETMEHILIDCQEPTARIIWNLAKEFWPHTTIPWPNINFGLILGCGSVSTHQENDQAQPPQNNETHQTSIGKRLLQILISESAHLIWVLRCERVIQGKNLTANEITARWQRVMNKRLTEDKTIATLIKRDQYTIQRTRSTWEKALMKQGEIPEAWIYHDEVLVGRGRRGV